MFLRQELKNRIAPHLLAVACVWVAVLAGYANSMDNGFHFDDEHSLTGNPHISTLENATDFFTDPQLFSRNVGSQMYRPIVLLTYALDYAAGGLDARVFHRTNTLIHGAVATLIYPAMLGFGAAVGAAWAAALLFAVHPLGAEPVNYISSRSESLAALFLLCSFVLHTRGRSRWVTALAVFCFGAALMCKASAIALLPLLLVYAWHQRRPLAEQVQQLWPFFVVGCGYLLVTRALIQEALVDAPVRSWTEQMSTQSKAAVYYLKLLAVPHPLSVDHGFSVAGAWIEPAVVSSLLLLVSMLAIAFRCPGAAAGAFQSSGHAGLAWCCCPRL